MKQLDPEPWHVSTRSTLLRFCAGIEAAIYVALHVLRVIITLLGCSSLVSSAFSFRKPSGMCRDQEGGARW